MAVHPPTGPFPPNDGSNIFRRGMPKPTAKPAPPVDDTQSPPEPAEPLDLDDEDALFGTATSTPGQAIDDLDAALSGVMLSDHGDDDQPISAILLNELPDAPTDEPVSAELLDDALSETSTPPPASAADSSIFAGGPLPPAGVGSGWLDPSASAALRGEPTSGDIWSNGGLPKDLPPPAQPPSTTKFEDAADLFAELRGDTPPSDNLWVEADGDEAENTGRVSESEVRRVLDSTRQGGSMPDFDLADEPLDPELIDGKEDAVGYDSSPSDPDADPGSSIFEGLAPPDTEIVTPADDIDFNIPVPADQNQASSMSGRLLSGGDDPDAVAADLFGGDTPAVPDDLPAEAFTDPVDGTDDRSPAIAAAVAAGALGGAAGSGKKGRPSSKVSPPTKRTKSVHDEPAPKRPQSVHSLHDDEPAPKEKKRGGIGGVLAGVATGLALGVGGFAIVYLTGLIPNEKKTAAVTGLAAPPGANSDPQASAKVNQLTTDLAAANEKADAATADAKKAHDELGKKQIALDTANNQLRTAKDDLTAAKKQAADAMASVEPLKKEVTDTKKEATDAVKAATDAKKLATDVARERDEAKTAFDVAKKDAEDKAKAATEADAKRIDAEKKLKTADDAVAGVLKELKASKLIDEKDDASKLPDAVKKLAAVAASGDAKKAAEALVAAQKERDAAVAALTKAEADTKIAQDAATKAKTDADKLVADAMKSADEKVKTAADEATKELKKQLADATTKAEADKKAGDAKLKSLEADFAVKLAEARAGVVKLVPAEMEADEKASRSYATGLTAYRGGKYADAQTAFAAATDINPADARYWYYLGLARTQTGTTGAEDAFKKGAEMEARNKPGTRFIDAALERLSFTDKQRVNKYRQ